MLESTDILLESRNNILQPWTVLKSPKSEICQRNMLRKKALIDLYKCMGSTCAYTTNVKSEMEKHLQSHTPRMKVFFCAYCSTKEEGPRSLVNHVEEMHGECGFQCMFCFYRAFEAANVVYHQHTYHGDAANTNSTIVALPSQAMQTKPDYLIEMCTSFQNKYTLLSCFFCHSTHASVALFDAHLSEHRVNLIECPVCSESLAKHEVRAHLNLHRSSFHKCLYCALYFNSKSLMYRHLSDDHPIRTMYCALKLECPSRSDIYVLENLGFDVPVSRLMVATYVNGDILLQSKTGDSQLLIVQRPKPGLPKIVKVQGGIKMAEDGTILNATDTISSKRTSASSISDSDHSSTKNAISGPSVARGKATVSITNTVNASGDRTVPSSSHATSKGTSNSPYLSEGRKLVPKQANGAVGNSVRKIRKLGNEPPSATSGNSGLVSRTPEQTYPSQMSKTDSLSTAKLTIAAGSTTAIKIAGMETSTASVSANRMVPLAQHDAAQEVGQGFKPDLGPIKPPQNIVKVKDFGFIKTSIAESKMTNTSHPCSSRNIVKLTRLDDGTLVIKLPSPSKPESQSVVGAPVKSCASAHMDAAKTELTEGNKINAPPGVVRAAQSGIINASASQQTLASKKQILPVKPLQAVSVTPVEQSVLNSNAAKSTEAKVIKSKAPTEVVRLVKSGIINTSSCVSSSKIVGSAIERSVPNSNTTKPTETEISKTKTPTGFMREVKSGKTVEGRSMEQTRPNTNAAKPSVIEVNNAKIPAGFTRVVNSGIIHTSVAPATAKEHILTLNPPHNVNVLNANTAKSTEANKRKAPTGAVRVMETGSNSISTSPSKNDVTTTMEQRLNSNATKPNSTGVNKARARSSSTAVNQVQPRTIDKLNSNPHKNIFSGNWITTNMRVPAATASPTVATVVNTSNKVVPESAPPSSLHVVEKQLNESTPHPLSSLLPVWDGYGVDLSSAEVKIPFRFIGYRINYDSFYKSLLDLISRNPLNRNEILICGAKDCQDHFVSKHNLSMHMSRHHLLFPSSVIPCKLCDCLLYGHEDYVRHMLIHLSNKFVCLCRYHHCLLSNVAEHIKFVHKCEGFTLSLGHPCYSNPLEDIIVVIPSGFGKTEIAKSIAMISTEQDSSKGEATVKVPTETPLARVICKANWSPVQVAIGDLYKCGFCKIILPSELSFQNHLLLCDQRNTYYYPCGHCEMRFLNWTKILNGICRHLFFHGENLYQCSTCEYKHFRKSVVMEHAKHHLNPIKSDVNVIRESNQLWSCHVCPFRSVFQQAIMNHMQNAHNLPGQRYICSLCDELMLTGIQSVRHYMHHHLGEKVTMLEMYNAISSFDGVKCSEMIEDKMEGMHMRNITFVKVSSLKTNDSISSLNVPMVESLDDNSCNTHDKSPPGKQNNVECEASEINGVKTLSNLRKRKAECLNDNNEKDPLIANDNTESGESGPDTQDQQHAKQIRLVKEEKDCVDNSAKNFEQLLPSLEQGSDLDTSLACSTSSSSSQRRASKRVAAKSEHSRWLESIKFHCETCDTSFGSLTDLETHGHTKNSSNDKTCPSVGNAKRFRLLPLARCYYCKEQDTSSALLLHCVVKHPNHSFVCVDYTDSRKCGLCSFHNESSDEVKLKSHFKLYHEVSEDKLNYYEYSDDIYLEWALCLGGTTPSNGIVAEINHLLYICNICNEENTSAIAMGMHVAQHFLKFACPRCPKEFKLLKVLYYHFLAMHLSEELVVSPTVGDEYDELLRNVLMVFQNGLIVSKHEARCTSVASLHELRLGLKSYRIEQLKILDEYKINLSLPIATIDEESSTTDTCKTFIQKQIAHPVVKLKCLSNEDVASLQEKYKKV